jgi:hypothetical protein
MAFPSTQDAHICFVVASVDLKSFHSKILQHYPTFPSTVNTESFYSYVNYVINTEIPDPNYFGASPLEILKPLHGNGYMELEYSEWKHIDNINESLKKNQFPSDFQLPKIIRSGNIPRYKSNTPYPLLNEMSSYYLRFYTHETLRKVRERVTIMRRQNDYSRKVSLQARSFIRAISGPEAQYARSRSGKQPKANTSKKTTVSTVRSITKKPAVSSSSKNTTKQKKNNTSTYQIPHDVWNVVCTFLPVPDILNISSVNKQIRDTVEQTLEERRKSIALIVLIGHYYGEGKSPYAIVGGTPLPEQWPEFQE